MLATASGIRPTGNGRFKRAIGRGLGIGIAVVVVIIIAAGSYAAISLTTNSTKSTSLTTSSMSSASSSIVATSSSASSQATSTQSVNFILDFTPSASEAPAYVAQDQGYFQKAGLSVSIISNPGGSSAAIRAVAAGRADFGLADIPTLMDLTATGNVSNVVVVGVIYHVNPMGILYLNNSGIHTPKDLEGKSVGTFQGSPDQIFFPVFAKGAGINQSKINFVYMSSSAEISSLLAGQVSAIELYTFNAADVQALAAPRHLNTSVFAYYNYGVVAYGLGLITSASTIANKPGLVQSFVQAYYAAIQANLGNPQTAMQDLQNDVQGINYTTSLAK
jgi:NitT/TauT family transport system substrate-binding protein